MGLIEMSVLGGVMIIIVVLFRSLLLHKLPKWVFLALWALVVVRLLVPFSMPGGISMQSIAQTVLFERPQVMAENMAMDAEPAVSRPLHALDLRQTTLAAEQAPSSAMRIPTALILWGLGLLIVSGYYAAAFLRNHRELRDALPVSNPLADDLIASSGIRRKIIVLSSDRIYTALATGLWHPRILLPSNMNLQDTQFTRYVVLHELEHTRRMDMLWKIVLIITLCIHWFNPLVWLLYLLANRDLELACDENVLKRLGQSTKAAYAMSLISIAEKRNRAVPLYSGFSKNAAEERILSIMKYKKMSLGALVLSVLLMLSMTSAFAFTMGIATPSGETQLLTSDDLTNDAETFAAYEPFGLLYDEATDLLHFNGQIVRYFEDSYALGVNTYASTIHHSDEGTIDVHAVRDFSTAFAKDSNAYDQSGTLIAVVQDSPAAFESRVFTSASEVMMASPVQSISVVEDTSNDNAGENGAFIQQGTPITIEPNLTTSIVSAPQSIAIAKATEVDGSVTISEVIYADGATYIATEAAEAIHATEVTDSTSQLAHAITAESATSIEDLYKPYEPFGLTFDAESDVMYFQGKKVRYFQDDNRAQAGNTNLSVAMFLSYTQEDGIGEIDVYAMHDQQGDLIGLTIADQATFDALTAQMQG